LEYLCWRRKFFPVSSELKPPLTSAAFLVRILMALNSYKRIIGKEDGFAKLLKVCQVLNVSNLKKQY
jgi:hypothetical protein